MMKRRDLIPLMLCIMTLLLSSETIFSQEKAAEKQALPDKASSAASDKAGWKDLFNGKDLSGWRKTHYGGEAEVSVTNNVILMKQSQELTGITSTLKDLPVTNYELSMEGRRTQGSDFFCAPTFPIGKSYASFVCAGWGDTVCGISCIDGYDASDNITTTIKEFKNNTWYTFRVRVTDSALQCWVDDEKIVEIPRKGYRFSTRFEMELNEPLGIANYASESEIRNIRYRLLNEEEIKETEKLVPKD